MKNVCLVSNSGIISRCWHLWVFLRSESFSPLTRGLLHGLINIRKYYSVKLKRCYSSAESVIRNVRKIYYLMSNTENMIVSYVIKRDQWSLKYEIQRCWEALAIITKCQKIIFTNIIYRVQCTLGNIIFCYW